MTFRTKKELTAEHTYIHTYIHTYMHTPIHAYIHCFTGITGSLALTKNSHELTIELL